MKKRIMISVLIVGMFFLFLPVFHSPSAGQAADPATDTVTEAYSGTREVRVYYIDTEDAGNLLEDTWIPEEYQTYCTEIGEQYGLSPYLLTAMIEQESSGDAEAVGSDGDTGLLQINPVWHRERMERLGVDDLTDPYSNILVAADYLAELMEQNDYNLPLALMKYNMDHEQAEQLMEQGICSGYARYVTARMWELTFLHEKRGHHDG